MRNQNEMALLPWKKIVQKLVENHKNKQSAVVKLDPHSKGEIVDLSNDELCMEIEGKELHAKKVRKFLWERRKRRALQRKRGLIWSAYLEEEDKSYVGVGAMTTKEVAERISNGRIL